MSKTRRAFVLLVISALVSSLPLSAIQQADPPKVKSFSVQGEVRRGGEKLWDEKMTVGRAIDLAGGMTEKGSLGRSYIQRKKDDNSISKISGLKVDTQILAGDILVVGRQLY